MVVVLQPVVDVADVLLEQPEAVEHALANRDARHDDHELAEPVLQMELGDRADVDVGLAGAGLHLDAEVERHLAGLQVEAIWFGIAGRSDPSSNATGRS